MKRILVVLATMVMGVLVASGVALAAEVSEAEPNDSIAEAQDIDASFDLTPNPDIAGATSVPHATVNGTGEAGVDPTHDFYSFTVPAGDPVRVILDIDHTTPDITPFTYDSFIELYDSSEVLLFDSDDVPDDPGSTTDDPSGRDSRLDVTLDPGTYYVGVGSCCPLPFPPVPAGATYKLHVSVGNDTTPPDTTITAGPAAGSTVNPGVAAFEFTAGEEATFDCRLDDPLGDFTSCETTYTGLSEGSHTLEVQATDVAGNVETEPASRTWTVSDATAPSVVSRTPLDGDTKVSRTNPNITATFSEEMGTFPANSFTLQKVRVQGKRETVLGTVSTTVQNPAAGQLNENVVRLALGTGVTLDKNSYYRVTITGAATDLLGNPLSLTTWRFKTAPN